MAQNLLSDGVTWDDVAGFHGIHRRRRWRIAIAAALVIVVVLAGGVALRGLSPHHAEQILKPQAALKKDAVRERRSRSLCDTLTAWADPRGVMVNEDFKKYCGVVHRQ